MKTRRPNRQAKRLCQYPEETETSTPSGPEGQSKRVKPDGTGEENTPSRQDRTHLSSDWNDAGEEQQERHSLRVVLVIVILMLVFISMITYFVAQMPPKQPR